MDKFDGDYDIGCDYERCDLSISISQTQQTNHEIFSKDRIATARDEQLHRPLRAFGKDTLSSLLAQRRLRKESRKVERDTNTRDRNGSSAESGPSEHDSLEFSDPLEQYYAEVRRLNHTKPEDDHRLQVQLAEVMDRLIDTISRIPGCSRFYLEEWQRHSFSNKAALTPRNEEELVSAPGPIELRIDASVLLDDAPEQDEPIASREPAFADTDLNLIQALTSRLDELYQSVRQLGVDHPVTLQRRVALSEVFRRLPLTPRLIEAQLAWLDSLLMETRCSYQRASAEQNVALARAASTNFEQYYALDRNEFEAIARQAFDFYSDWHRVRNRIVEFHVGLVIYHARQYSSDPQELVDFIQEGNIGLIKAVERFDYRLGFKFSTYATYWIRLAISRHLARCGRTVRIPYRQNLQFGSIRKKREHFTQIHGRAPTMHELSADTGISAESLHKLETLSQTVTSLDAPLEAGENLDLLSMIEQSTFNQPAEVVEKQRMDGLIEKAIGGLNKREAYVIRQRFGIGEYAEKTLQELGTALGVTRERVRQIECGALKKIRRYFEPLAVL